MVESAETSRSGKDKPVPTAAPVDLLEQLPGIVYCCQLDPTRTMLYASRGCFQVTGYTPADLEQNHRVAYGHLIHQEDKPAVFLEISVAAASDRPFRAIYRLITAAGEERWVLERGRVLDSVEGAVVVGFITDHTERMINLQQQDRQLAILEERNRLARELHDSVSQSLYSVTLFAEAGQNLAQQGRLEQAVLNFADVLETSQQAMKEMRLLVHRLRPSRLAEEGFVRTLQHRLNAVERRAGIRTHFLVEDDVDIAPDWEDALYHIAQEALNNGIKHATASEVKVSLRQDSAGDIFLEISDDGCGFDVAAALVDGGLGLTSMSERAALAGGTVNIHSSPGLGTAVQVQLHSGDKEAASITNSPDAKKVS